jgi:hypothetical protein
VRYFSFDFNKQRWRKYLLQGMYVFQYSVRQHLQAHIVSIKKWNWVKIISIIIIIKINQLHGA